MSPTIYNHEYYLNNKEKISERNHIFHLKNKEKINERKRKYTYYSYLKQNEINKEKRLVCQICDCKILNNDFVRHLKGNNHKININLYWLQKIIDKKD